MKIVYLATLAIFFSKCGMDSKEKKIDFVVSKNKNNFDLESPSKFVANSEHYQTKNIVPHSVLMGYLIDGYKVKLSQNSGIHNYLVLPSRLFGMKKVRPTSSGYFDLILEK